MIIYNRIKNKTASVTGVSRSVKNGRCWAFFIEPGVKVDGKYSQDVLHRNKCYPLSDMFVQVTAKNVGGVFIETHCILVFL